MGPATVTDRVTEPQVASHQRPGRVDDLTLLGVVALTAWVLLAAAWIGRGRAGQLLWLSDVALLLTAVGFLTRSRVLLSAQFIGVLAWHLAWQIDLAAYVWSGDMPTHAIEAMITGDLSLAERSLSLFQHAFLIPATAWGILRLGVARFAWLLQTGQTILLLAGSRLFTAPSHNVNWVFGAPFADLSPAGIGLLAFYLLLLLVPPLLLYLPAHVIARWLERSTVARSLRTAGARFQAKVAAAGTAVVVATSLGTAAALPAPAATDASSLDALEALPVDSRIVELTAVTFDSAGGAATLPLRTLDAPLPRSIPGGGIPGPLYMKSLLATLPVDSIPAAPQLVVVHGRRNRGDVAIVAIVASDRLYPQPGADSTAAPTVTLPVRLGRDGPAEFASDDPYVVGNGSGALYAVTLVAFSADGPVARTPFQLFRRTVFR